MNHRWLFSGPTMLHIISFTSHPPFYVVVLCQTPSVPPAFSVALLFFFLEHLDVELLVLFFFCVKSEGKDQSPPPPPPPPLLSMKHYMYDNEKRQQPYSNEIIIKDIYIYIYCVESGYQITTSNGDLQGSSQQMFKKKKKKKVL